MDEKLKVQQYRAKFFRRGAGENYKKCIPSEYLDNTHKKEKREERGMGRGLLLCT